MNKTASQEKDILVDYSFRTKGHCYLNKSCCGSLTNDLIQYDAFFKKNKNIIALQVLTICKIILLLRPVALTSYFRLWLNESQFPWQIFFNINLESLRVCQPDFGGTTDKYIIQNLLRDCQSADNHSTALQVNTWCWN